MRAEERHRLKTNELAQKLSELPEYLRKHSKIISVGIVVLVAVGVVGSFWWSARKKSYSRRNEELQGLFPQVVQIQDSVAKAAQDPKTQSETTYNISSLLGALGNLSSEAQGTPVGMMALMQQADLERSELYYTHRQLSDQEREKIYRTSESLYQQILKQYGQHAQAMGMAKLGLALLAEDRGDWDKAKKTYDEILAEKDGKLTGTTFPLLAKRRLRMIDDIDIPIEFPYIEPKPEEPKGPEGPGKNADDINTYDAGKSVEPLKIEIPQAPVPQIKPETPSTAPGKEEPKVDTPSVEPVKPETKPSEEKPVEKKEKKEN